MLVGIDLGTTHSLVPNLRIPLTGEQHRLVVEHNPGVLTREEIERQLAALEREF